MKQFCIILIFVLFLPVFCLASQNKAVKMANNYITAGMTHKAIQTLEHAIQEKPMDVDANWMLGKLYLRQESYSLAETKFNIAVILKPSLKSKLGNLYKVAGSSALSKGNINHAISLFANATNFDVGLRKTIGQECFTKGKGYLSPGRSMYADKLFSFAKASDSSLSADIRETQLSYGNFMLEVANSKPKPERKKYINEANKYLSQSKIDKVSPPSPWQTVYKRTFVGVGNTGGDEPEYNDGGIFTAKNGIDTKKGDRYTVVDTNFELWLDGKWKKFARGHWVMVKDIEQVLDLTFRNSKGQKFTVVVQRYID